MSTDLNHDYIMSLISGLRDYKFNNPPTDNDIDNIIISIRDCYDGTPRLFNTLVNYLSPKNREEFKNVPSNQLACTILDTLFNNYKNQTESQIAQLRNEIDYIKDSIKK